MVERHGAEFHQPREADLITLKSCRLNEYRSLCIDSLTSMPTLMRHHHMNHCVRDRAVMRAGVAQLVEHVLGKDGVTGSIPVSSFLLETVREER